MADRSLMGVPTDQPGDLASDAGHLWEGKQALYLAELEADRGQQGRAAEFLSKAMGEFSGIADAGTSSTAWAAYGTANDYVQKAALQSQEALQTQTAVADGNYQQGRALTPDQYAAFANDNGATARSMNQGDGWGAYLTYGANTVAEDTKAVARTAGSVGDELGVPAAAAAVKGAAVSVAGTVSDAASAVSDKVGSVAGALKWPFMLGAGVLLMGGGIFVAWRLGVL